MTHPVKAHNAVAALVEMYGESVAVLLRETEQYRSRIAQLEAERAKLIKRVADMESVLRTPREGTLRTTEDRRRNGNAGTPTDTDDMYHMRGEVADDVFNGSSTEAHKQFRNGASSSGSVETCTEGASEWLMEERSG